MGAIGASIAVGSLEQALDRCRNRETSGFDAVYREFGRTLYGTARRMLSRPEDAEDAMQDTFLAFCRTLPDVPASQVGAWLHRVLVNRCIDRLRRGQRWREGELEGTGRRRPSGPRAGYRSTSTGRWPASRNRLG